MSLAHWTMINLLGPLLAIISVERMLRANHIDTEGILSSSGQMMALLTGIGSLCMALTELMKDIWAKDQPDVVEDLLTAYAYCSSSPLSDVRTKSAVQQFIDLECQRDPAFLEELIQLPKEGHSTLMTDSVRASNRDIANLALSTSDPDTPTSPKATTLKFMATA
ncbi:hypothetical protein BDV26DRAFT_274074 [Aspergillus bertholletiae]|uniref:Uncharacterized protein n=1 Tax=Aspergillus bertholletiae TaxID=1226010 RepID=A0A5N7ARM4_9EURO|nr:hypothetical protein BDV26DRAFT_274074 [Aspergillus bertholletiae]